MPDPTAPNTAAVNPPPVATVATTAGPIHDALDWLRKQADGIVAKVDSIRLSKPAAEIAAAAETVLEAALPAALQAGEVAVLDVMTPAHLAALEAVSGAILFPAIKQVLARVPAVTKGKV